MKDIIKALNRRERVEILYRGRPKGVIIPVNEKSLRTVKKHPLYGMLAADKKPVNKIMAELRAERYVV